MNLKNVIESGRWEDLQRTFFYGNGTARDVRNSPWRDQGFGVLPDLGSHLLDMVLFLFGNGGRLLRAVAGGPFRESLASTGLFSASTDRWPSIAR